MPDRPNVLLLIADDHRHDALSCAGDPTVATPTLDRLAGTGVRFRGARCQGGMTGAICAPSRACLMTGSSVFTATAGTDIGTRAATLINPDKVVLPEALGGAGYATFAIGKWHNGGDSLARGFADGSRLFLGGMSDHHAVPLQTFDRTGAFSAERACPGDGFSTDIFADSAIDFLRTYDQPDPFFCYVAFTAPHDPRTPPGRFATMYDPTTIPLPPNFLPEHPFDNGDLEVRDERLAARPRDPAEIRQHLADYYGMISHLDDRIGTVLAALRETGRDRNTIIIYTADHGLALGQHGLLGKQSLYEHSSRIPLIMAGPGIPAGQTVDGFAYLTDIFPTLCDLLNVSRPDTVEGTSLTPLIHQTAGQVRQYAHAAYLDIQRMATDGHHKLIRYQRSARGAGSNRIQLFDLHADPWEINDISADPAQQHHIAALTASLDAWQKHTGDPLIRN